jgi:hypothetical protein
LQRLERDGHHELLAAIDAKMLTVYAAACAVGYVTRPEPLGTGSPNARKRIDWTIHQAYRESERADAAPEPEPVQEAVQETPPNGRSTSTMPDLVAALAEVAEMHRAPAPVTTITETVTKPATQKSKKAKPVVTRLDPRALIA